MVVATGVIILRHTKPDVPRGFRVPFYRVLAISASSLHLSGLQSEVGHL